MGDPDEDDLAHDYPETYLRVRFPDADSAYVEGLGEDRLYALPDGDGEVVDPIDSPLHDPLDRTNQDGTWTIDDRGDDDVLRLRGRRAGATPHRHAAVGARLVAGRTDRRRCGLTDGEARPRSSPASCPTAPARRSTGPRAAAPLPRGRRALAAPRPPRRWGRVIDPEIQYRRIVSGNAGALTSAADTLADVGHDLDDAAAGSTTPPRPPTGPDPRPSASRPA